MKTYKGVLRGSTVVLDQKPDVEDGTEALVLVKVSEEDEKQIVTRQKAMLEKGFPMGKLRYKSREELHARRK